MSEIPAFDILDIPESEVNNSYSEIQRVNFKRVNIKRLKLKQ
jgi:hypothetical protein